MRRQKRRLRQYQRGPRPYSGAAGYLAPRGGGAPSPYDDDFANLDGSWTNLTVSGGVARVDLSVGSEELSNGDFELWSGDNPLYFSVLHETPPREVTEVGSGGGVGTGYARFNAVGGYVALRRTDVLTANKWYRLAVTIDTYTSGSFSFRINDASLTAWNSTGAKYETALGTSVALDLFAGSGTDVVIDDASVKEITGFLAHRDYGVAQALARAKVWRADGTQAGVIHYVDGNNWVGAYLGRAGTVNLLKCVSGIITPITSAAITYSAGAMLELSRPANGQYVVKYGGAEKINNSAITDSIFDAATRWGLLQTDASGTYFDDWHQEAA